MSESEFVKHVPCEACGSSDANSLYTDGHTYCFSCGRTVRDAEDSTERRPRVSGDFLQGEARALRVRALTEETCRKYSYRVAGALQVADFRTENGELVAQKTRNADKEFRIIGDGSRLPLFGMHLWQRGGKRLVIAEGEIDAMSVSQAFGNKWPAVSVPNGAPSAKKAIQNNFEYAASFDQVVLAFDMDEPGRAAAVACAALFRPGQCVIAELPRKDANEMLQHGEVQQLVSAIYQAKAYRPDGIVNAADLWEKVTERLEPGLPYPWPKLTKLTYGQRRGTITTWAAGSGTGKSSILAQVAYDLAYVHGLKVGYVALEESVGRSAQRFLGLHLRKLVHLPGVATEAELRTAFDATLAQGNVWFFDHFGSSDADNLLAKLRYLAVACEVDVLVLDHLSIAVSGLGLDNDERRTVDHLMTALRSLVEETDVICHVISHLRRAPAEETSAEEGGRVSLAMLRGSHSIAQLSDLVIGVERDLQSEDKTMLIRVLKNRVSGDTGVAGSLEYDRKTGWISEVTKKSEAADDAKDF